MLDERIASLQDSISHSKSLSLVDTSISDFDRYRREQTLSYFNLIRDGGCRRTEASRLAAQVDIRYGSKEHRARVIRRWGKVFYDKGSFYSFMVCCQKWRGFSPRYVIFRSRDASQRVSKDDIDSNGVKDLYEGFNNIPISFFNSQKQKCKINFKMLRKKDA